MHQGSRHNFICPSTLGLLHGCYQGAGQGWGLISRLKWRKIYFYGHVAVGRIQFPADCRTEDLSFLLALGRKTPLVLCYVDLPTWPLASSKPARWDRYCNCMWCHHTSDIIHLYYILFLEASYRFYIGSRRGNYTKTRESRGRNEGQSPKSLSTTNSEAAMSFGVVLSWVKGSGFSVSAWMCHWMGAVPGKGCDLGWSGFLLMRQFLTSEVYQLAVFPMGTPVVETMATIIAHSQQDGLQTSSLFTSEEVEVKLWLGPHISMWT